MFQGHNPSQQAFDWYCHRIGVTEGDRVAAAVELREPVKKLRDDYREPFGKNFAYGNIIFQHSYLVAYFPYYIEPLYRVLRSADIPQSLFSEGKIEVSFFGGGPCPESLGLAAYLKEKAPELQVVDVKIFDREYSWSSIQQKLLPQMFPEYGFDKTAFSVHSCGCNVLRCDAKKCHNRLAVVDSRIIVAQNFLSEVQTDAEKAINTFAGIIRRSKCRYLVFIENNYDENKGLLGKINQHFYQQNLSNGLAKINYDEIRPDIELPEVLRRHLFTWEDGLKPKKNVKYHSMVIEIARS